MTSKLLRGLSSALLGVFACRGGRVEAHTDFVRRAAMEHGIDTGTVVPLLRFSCDDGPIELGADDAPILVTFGTMTDCAMCEAHLGGVADLIRRGRLPARSPLVILLGPRPSPRVLAFLKQSEHRPVCPDTGEAWSKLDLRHTPFTVVIANRRIAYIHDQPIQSNAQVDAFLTDVHQWLR
jgi:hypothetical protein